MFSSNQILQITGNLDNKDIETTLEFILKLSGHYEHMKQSERDRGYMLTYQITDKGTYCIGWGIENIPVGWEKFHFDYDIPTIANEIKEQLDACIFDYPKYPKDLYDGETSKGFIVRDMNSTESIDDGWIANPYYGIVEFAPYVCYNAK